jgi:hypothetical protein
MKGETMLSKSPTATIASPAPTPAPSADAPAWQELPTALCDPTPDELTAMRAARGREYSSFAADGAALSISELASELMQFADAVALSPRPSASLRDKAAALWADAALHHAAAARERCEVAPGLWSYREKRGEQRTGEELKAEAALSRASAALNDVRGGNPSPDTVAAMRESAAALIPTIPTPAMPSTIPAPDYIDLDQAAALVNRSKRTLERKSGVMPLPAVEGGGGKKAEWLWNELRPWLEKEYGKVLPDRPPHAIR